MNVLKYHWYETSLLSQAVLKHVVSKDFIFKRPVLYPAKNEEIYGIVPYQNISCHVHVALLISAKTVLFLFVRKTHKATQCNF